MRPNLARTKSLRLNAAAAAVINLMRYGQSPQLEFYDTGPRWRLSGGGKAASQHFAGQRFRALAPQ
jgi:hypothetical protein